VDIHVLQGERELAAYNKTIGRFRLEGIPPAPRAVPQIEVTFDIDANGILNVSAKDTATGKEQKITITASSGLSDTEIEQMVKDAESHAEDDKARREEIDIRNRGEQFAYETEKNLKEFEETMPADAREKVDEALTALKEAIESGGVEGIKTATEALEQVWYQASSELYQQAGAAAGEEGMEGEPASEADASAGSDEEVIDADFEVVDDEDENDEKKDA